MKGLSSQWRSASLVVKVGILSVPLAVGCLLMALWLVMSMRQGESTFPLFKGEELVSEYEEDEVWQGEDMSWLSQEESSNETLLELENEMIYVDVKGAVMYPNVYALPSGSRLFDVIELAGGLLPNAATHHLNQAQLLSDQLLVYIYSLEELETEGLSDVSELAPTLVSPIETTYTINEEDLLVNLNSASAVELQTLPGIGPKKAEAIIIYRELHGSFATIEALMEVKGIGAKTFEQLAPLIRVE